MKKNNHIVTILLSIMIVLLVIILIIVLVKDSKKDSNTPNYKETNNYIGKDKALDIALEHAKLKESEVYDLSIELEDKYNARVYEIDFNYKNYDYEYYVDALTGDILHSFKEID